MARRAWRISPFTRFIVAPWWFRPGYPENTRDDLWRRLAPDYREHLRKQHEAGAFRIYLPSRAFVEAAALISASSSVVTPRLPSSFAPPTSPGLAADDDVQIKRELDAIATPEQVAAIERLVAAHGPRPMLVDNIEPADLGAVVPVDDEPWYAKPANILKMGLAGVILLIFANNKER